MKKTLYLIDGTALGYRSHFAFIKNPLINSKGFNTSSIYGTINAFIKILEKFQPEHIMIAFDRKEPTFRHEMYKEYKAHRPPMPPDLILGMEAIKEFFSLAGLNDISMAGYEADDILGTLAKKYVDDYNICLITGDKDYNQLLEDGISLWDPFKEIMLETPDVLEKYGVSCDQFIDYLALMGDSSAHIPGAEGIGPKTATSLLQQFGSIENIYQHLDEIKSASVKDKMERSRERVEISRKLARIETNAPLPDFPHDRMHFHKNDLRNTLPFLSGHELTSIYKKISGWMTDENFVLPDIPEAKDVPEGIKFKPVLVDNEYDFLRMLDELKKPAVISLDTETTSLNPFEAELAGISLCNNLDKAYYISIGHRMSTNLDQKYVLEHLQTLIEGKLIIGHNIKYDYLVLDNHGFVMNNRFFDTMIASYLLDSGTLRHNLDECALKEFGHENIKISSLIGTGKSQIGFDELMSEEAFPYAAEDAYVSYRLYLKYKQQLEDLELTNLFNNIEIPLVSVLIDMQKNGVFLDLPALAILSDKLQKRAYEITQDVYKIAGYQFNVNSTQQLGKLLFEDLKIPALKKTKTGYSTDTDVLESLSEKYEIARLLMEYRQIAKLDSTYAASLPRLINPQTRRIHSSFNQTIASTGRLSSSNPNLQNIPIRMELGREIRKAFIAEKEGWSIVSADYSQIELRLMALFCRDENMVNAFRNNEDIHQQTASVIFDKPLAEVTSDERRKAKVINFGIIYGMGSVKLAKEISITQKEAKQFIENYFIKFPSIKQFMQDQVYKAKQDGFVSTLFGRKLFLPNLTSTNGGLIAEAERVAVNMPIQGTAADLIKIAMIDIYKKIKNNPHIKMLIQVHDELVFEVENEYIKEAEDLITDAMKSALPAEYSKIVPLEVEVGSGKSWYDAH